MWGQLVIGGILAAALAAAGTGLYFEGKKSGRNEQIAKQAVIEEVAEEAAKRSANIAADAISKIKVQNRTVYNEVQREILERAVYRDCQHTPDQLRRINEAITGQPAEPAGRGLVPATGTAGGLQLRGNDAEADRGSGAVPGVSGGGTR